MYSQFGAISLQEWLLIYAPLVGIVLAALFIETRTSSIPNWLNYSALWYLSAMRLAIGPAPFWQYLGSCFAGGVLLIALVYSTGIAGGGMMKLVIACLAAFVLGEGLFLTLQLVLISFVLLAANRLLQFGTVPGSLVVLLVIGTHLSLRTMT